MSFGITNGVACFQCKIDDLIAENELEDTFAYLDNVTKSVELYRKNMMKIWQSFVRQLKNVTWPLMTKIVYFQLDPSTPLVTELVEENLALTWSHFAVLMECFGIIQSRSVIFQTR